jgi:hypothetical protein
VKRFLLLAVLVGSPAGAAAQYATSPPSAVPPPPSPCQLALAPIAEFRPLSTLLGPGECGAADVVLLQSVILDAKAKVAIVPPATLRCTMAEQVARWVREDVLPATQIIVGAPPRRLDNLDSYDCRSQNRIAGAVLSEHGRANALDVGDFKLADGRVLGLTDVNVDKAWRELLRASACARFATVLGPGSDSYHDEHIHLDLAERHGNYKICQWDVREPVVQAETIQPGPESAPAIDDPVPLPRPRPLAGAVAASAAKPPKIQPAVR